MCTYIRTYVCVCVWVYFNLYSHTHVHDCTYFVCVHCTVYILNMEVNVDMYVCDWCALCMRSVDSVVDMASVFMVQ